MKRIITLILLFIATASFRPETKVLICMSGTAYAYHDHYCQGLKKCTHEVKEVTVTEAKRMNYKPCGYCYK